MARDEHKLLKEYVRSVVISEDFGGGVEFTNKQGLINIFIEPFLDVFKVAKGKALELHQRTLALGRVAFTTIVTTMVPFLGDRYEEVFREEHEYLDKIRLKYADVYNATWDAFKQDDALCMAFMLNPTAFLTTQFFLKAPKGALNLVSSLTNGSLDPFLDKVKEQVKTGGFKEKKSRKSSEEAFKDKLYAQFKKDDSYSTQIESRLYESDESNTTPVNWLAKVLSSKQVKEKVAESPKVHEMQEIGKKLVAETLKKVLTQASGVLKAKNLSDVEKATGKKVPGTEKLANVPKDEKQALEEKLVSAVKASMKTFYVKKLEERVKKAIDAGVPADHPFVSAHKKAVSHIQSM